jgi:hypothetical protein
MSKEYCHSEFVRRWLQQVKPTSVTGLERLLGHYKEKAPFTISNLLTIELMKK